MTNRRIAVIGATGMLGRPVTRKLIAYGFQVTVVAREPARATGLEGARIIRGDVFDLQSLCEALRDQDAVYVSLTTHPDEGPHDRHLESDGLRNVVEAARRDGVRRISFISSMVKSYQGHDGFHWWSFDVKNEAVSILRASGIPYTIFYPSSFMENFTHSQRQGNKILLAGTSRQKMYFIAGDDYGSQVARDFSRPGDDNREYPVQGLEGFTYDEAAKVFVEHYDAARLRISRFPMFVLRLFGLFSRKYANAAKVVQALNEYPETFRSEGTWKALGRPTITLVDFARRASREEADRQKSPRG